MSQVDKINFIPHLFWFLLAFIIIYFLVYSFVVSYITYAFIIRVWFIFYHSDLLTIFLLAVIWVQGSWLNFKKYKLSKYIKLLS